MADSIPFVCERLRYHRIVLALVLLAITCPLTAAEPDQAAKDQAAVKKFLAAQYADKTWQQGPAAMQNGALDKAFPGVRFYYVFSSQLPQPKAELVSVMMRVQDGGKVAEVSGPASMSQGLMKVVNSADAQVAAAAIMSLTFGPSGPVSISAGDVPVARLNGGWFCLATPGPPGQKQALQVIFDADGHCTDITHRDAGGP